MNEQEEYLIQKFEDVINANHEKIPKLLNLEKQIVQFDVKDTALPGHFKIVLCDDEKGGAQLFLNNHLTSIHYEDSFADFKFIKKGDLEKQILQDIYQNDISYVQLDADQVQFEKEMIESGYKDAFENVHLQQNNLFTSTFSYNYMDNEYIGVNSSTVSDITFKNYSTDEIQTNLQIQSNPQPQKDKLLKIDNFNKYSSQQSIINDFTLLGSQVESYFAELKAKQARTTNINQFQNQQYLSIDQIVKICQFQRIQTILQNSKQNEIKKKEKSTQKNEHDPEQIFKQLKSDWEEEQMREEEMNNIPQLQILAHLDFDTMMEKVEDKIKFQEQLEEQKIKEFNKEYNEFNFNVDEDNIKNKGQEETHLMFNNIKLGDSTDLADKRLQLSSRYEWATEDNFDISLFEQAVPKEKMAQKYPFELDFFQKRSVYRMERGESVFVCAHTSAGKTVVAEYAISLSKKINRKAIYTSPIKALSNQKYRDFKLKYGDDVGLVTGDVSLNPNASCLIVTTEILRNMLYKNHDIIRDIEWVIFDEVHYVNNPERGVVWEETIIMLPQSVGFVMLSATVPNYMEFANWVGRTKQRKMFVQKTDYRPVPLEHSVYVDGEMMVIKSGDDAFNPTNYEQIRSQIFKNQALQEKQLLSSKKKQKLEKIQKGTFKNTNSSMRNKRTMKSVTEKYIKTTDEDDYNDSGGQTSEGFALMQLLIKCSKEQLLPCVVFVFSKKKIEELYQQISQLNFCDYEESVIIEQYFKKCARRIKPRDLNVPQIQTIKQLLLRGIGVHHGDVIPFLKEVIEILFSLGLIKVLLATETFAMGINMPTKTVIFHSLKKYDSLSMRLLNSSEFTQMSGRAGRRGLDTKGNVIIFVQSAAQLPTKKDLSVILDHRGQLLESKFKISYETIINLLNSQVLNVVDMMKKSYQENHKYAQLPDNIKRLKELKSKYYELQQFKCIKQAPGIELPPIEDYIKHSSDMGRLSLNYFAQDRNYIIEKMELPSYCVIYDHEFKFHVGMIIYINLSDKFKERFLYVLYVDKLNSQKESPVFNFKEDSYEYHVVENHHYCDTSNFEEYSYKIYKLSLSCIVKIYDDDPGIVDGDLEDPVYIEQCVQKLIIKQQEFKEFYLSEKVSKTKMKRRQFKEMDFKATEISKVALNQNLDNVYTSLCHSCEIKSEHIGQVIQRKQVKEDLQELIKKIDGNDLSQRCSFESKLKILQELKYVDSNNKPTFKAKVFKEVQNIYVTELVFSELLEFLNESEIAALLSGFICQGKAKNSKYDPIQDFDHNYGNYMIFIDTYTMIIENVQEIVKQEIKHGVVVASSESEYLYDVVYIRDLIEIVLFWMNGGDFQQICSMTNIQEGAIVKSFLRLENLLKNVRNGYRIMGNYGMSQKIDRSMEMLKKDIIFSKSLYLDSDQ